MRRDIPIAPYLLIHNVLVKEARESSASSLKRPSANSNEHKFKRVRVQTKDTSSVSPTGINNTPTNKGQYTLFVDYVNSINPDHYTPKMGDKVTWEGLDREIVGMSSVYATNPDHPHHLELTLE